ncbi:NlpC/P60 family protein [Fructilactobacillus sanfranciscensis]|uniref:NlpC/P60 family protein n=1 Tax=Fructilactobacillus sanfranciscensis TaxID=1625 RepID=UPI0031FA3CAC
MNKVHYKMFKAGKKWMIAGITTVAISTGAFMVNSIDANADVVSNVSAYLGTPYQYGGNSSSGIDCSALVQAAYAADGINLPRTSGEQYGVTTQESAADAQPGDLVFFGSYGSDHVGIYTGNGNMINAETVDGVTSRQISVMEKYLGPASYGRVNGATQAAFNGSATDSSTQASTNDDSYSQSGVSTTNNNQAPVDNNGASSESSNQTNNANQAPTSNGVNADSSNQTNNANQSPTSNGVNADSSNQTNNANQAPTSNGVNADSSNQTNNANQAPTSNGVNADSSNQTNNANQSPTSNGVNADSSNQTNNANQAPTSNGANADVNNNQNNNITSVEPEKTDVKPVDNQVVKVVTPTNQKDTLPATGETKNSLLTVIGLGLISFVTLLGFKIRKNN